MKIKISLSANNDLKEFTACLKEYLEHEPVSKRQFSQYWAQGARNGLNGIINAALDRHYDKLEKQ